MLNQSNKDPTKVTAAKQALKGKLSKPMPKKTAQVFFVDSNVIHTMPVAARTPSVLPTGPQGVSAQCMPCLFLWMRAWYHGATMIMFKFAQSLHVCQLYKQLPTCSQSQGLSPDLRLLIMPCPVRLAAAEGQAGNCQQAWGEEEQRCGEEEQGCSWQGHEPGWQGF